LGRSACWFKGKILTGSVSGRATREAGEEDFGMGIRFGKNEKKKRNCGTQGRRSGGAMQTT